MEELQTNKEEEKPEEKTAPAPKKNLIGAITLVLYDSLDCDILAKTIIDNNEFSVDANLLPIFRGFLEDVCQGINFSQVLTKMLSTKSAES